MTRFRELFHRATRNASGSTAVEFALIMPIFIAMIFAIVEFGRLLWIRNSMEMAVETAARYGAITSGATEGTIEAYAATQLIGVDSSTVTFNATPCTANTVTVNATHTFTTVAAYFVPALTSLDLSVTATFAC